MWARLCMMRRNCRVKVWISLHYTGRATGFGDALEGEE